MPLNSADMMWVFEQPPDLLEMRCVNEFHVRTYRNAARIDLVCVRV